MSWHVLSNFLPPSHWTKPFICSLFILTATLQCGYYYNYHFTDKKTVAHRGDITVLPKELTWKLRISWFPAVVWMLSCTRMMKPGWQLMPVYAVEFRTAPDEQEPLQRCSIDAAVYISLSALPGFLGGSDSQESACSAGDSDSISGSERSPGEGNDYLLQYSCLENSMDRGTWWATVHGVTKSQTRLSDSNYYHYKRPPIASRSFSPSPSPYLQSRQTWVSFDLADPFHPCGYRCAQK